MAEYKNPLKVLGISRDIIRRMSDDNIRILIKANYRALQLIYHPDSGGSERRSRELNEAYSALEKEDFFQACKEQYLMKGKKEKPKSQEPIAQNDEFYYHFVNYLSSAGSGLSVLNLTSRRLTMYDNVAAFNVSTIGKSLNPKSLFYELAIDRHGRITKKRGKVTEKCDNSRIIGSIPGEVAAQLGGIKSFMRRVYPIRHIEDVRADRMLHGRASGETHEAQRRIDVESFKVIFPFLTQRVEKRDYLFSFNRDEQGVYFSLEGMVHRILRD